MTPNTDTPPDTCQSGSCLPPNLKRLPERELREAQTALRTLAALGLSSVPDIHALDSLIEARLTRKKHMAALSVKELREKISERGIDAAGCVEKEDMIRLLLADEPAKAADEEDGHAASAAALGLSIEEWRELPPHMPKAAAQVDAMSVKELRAVIEHAGLSIARGAEKAELRQLAQQAQAALSEQWKEFGGEVLEPVLRSGAIAMLDAAWMVRLAEQGGVLSRRQDLPQEAFVSLEEIKACCVPSAGTWPIVVISYTWLQPDHPDPKGEQLRLIARVLNAFLLDEDFPRLGVVMDLVSLHQHPHPHKRPPSEQRLFEEALGSLGAFYGHPKTLVFRLTKFPAGYPSGYSLPVGANVATYPNRGWTATEQAWASMTKYSRNNLDLGRCDAAALSHELGIIHLRNVCCGGGCPAPLLPSQFEASLATKSFTRGKDDRPLVVRLYSDMFYRQFRGITKLRFFDSGWGDAEFAQLCAVLGSGSSPQLETLEVCDFLTDGSITDIGPIRAALAELPVLKHLCLYDLKFHDISPLAEALRSNSAPLLEKLELTLMPRRIGVEGAKAIVSALRDSGRKDYMQILRAATEEAFLSKWAAEHKHYNKAST